MMRRPNARSAASGPGNTQFGKLIQDLIHTLERQGPKPFRFADLAPCDKRRQSDLLSILSALEVLGHVSQRLLIWRGFNGVVPVLIRVGVQNEIRSQSQPIQKLFSFGKSPSLAELSLSFLSLYGFIGATCLNLREVSEIMSDSLHRSKKILRRLYSVVFVLEQLEILERGAARSEYWLKLSLDSIVEGIFKRLESERPFLPGSIALLMNRFGRGYIRRVQTGHADAYAEAVRRFREVNVKDQNRECCTFSEDVDRTSQSETGN
jgi:hypothetical protein